MMDQYFAEMYATPGHDEEKEKVAQAEAFAKLAAQNDIDLNQLTDEQIAELWDATFADDVEPEKTASAEELYEQAQQEFSGVASVTDMQKQADAFGRQAAHSFHAELQEIEKSGARKSRRSVDTGVERLADQPKPEGEPLQRKQKRQVFSGEGSRKAKVTSDARKARWSQLKGGAAEAVGKGKELAGKAWGGAKAHRGKLGIGAGLATAAGGGYAAYEAMKNKEGSALDQLAGEAAFEKAAEAGWEQEELAARLNAVLTLGAGESEKVAQAEDTDQAIEIRSLELLELAGYPVNWE